MAPALLIGVTANTQPSVSRPNAVKQAIIGVDSSYWNSLVESDESGEAVMLDMMSKCADIHIDASGEVPVFGNMTLLDNYYTGFLNESAKLGGYDYVFEACFAGFPWFPTIVDESLYYSTMDEILEGIEGSFNELFMDILYMFSESGANGEKESLYQKLRSSPGISEDYVAVRKIAIDYMDAFFTKYGIQSYYNSAKQTYKIIKGRNVYEMTVLPFVPINLQHGTNDKMDIFKSHDSVTITYPVGVSAILSNNAMTTVTKTDGVFEYTAYAIQKSDEENGDYVEGSLGVRILQKDNFFKRNHIYRINFNNCTGEFIKASLIANGQIENQLKGVSIVMNNSTDEDGNTSGYIYFEVVEDIPEGAVLFTNGTIGTNYYDMSNAQWQLLINQYNDKFVGTSRVITSIEDQDNTLHDGETKQIYLDVDDNYTQERILSEVRALDLFGKEVAVTVASSDYETGKTGTFTIILSASDNYGQTATASLVIYVGDYSAPTIIQNNEIKYTYNSVVTEEMLLSNFTFADNMGTAGLTYQFTYPTGFDLSKPLVFGNYSLSVTVTDAFGNSTSHDFIINVVDETAPRIMKKDGNVEDKIGIGYSSLGENTLARILDLYKAEDAIDGNCDVYLKNGKIPSGLIGDFSLTLGAMDKSGNEAIATITCEIIADIPPVFILSNKLVSTTINDPLTLDDLVQVVQNGLLRDVKASNITVNARGYLADTTAVKDHPVSYSYTDESGEIKTSSFTLRVIDDSDLEPVKPVEEDNFFVHAFKTVFTDIKNATGIDWFVVCVTILVPLFVLGLLIGSIKKRF